MKNATNHLRVKKDPAPTRTGHYRPEIDGLRALAVVAVVLFHTGILCPGGYIGVDVFFVISGYLITSVILRDLSCGRFSMLDFWERRIRRIFPAVAVMTATCLIVGLLILLPSDLENLGKSALAQAFLAANLFFWRQPGGYFADYELQPLLHTWSLAIEEQYYLLFPLVLLLIARRRSTGLVFWLCLGIGISLVLSIGFLASKERAVFYLLPTRAWELLIGSLLAALPVGWMIHKTWQRELITLAGLTAILLPIFFYTKNTPFPGFAGLPPCLGTALVIWANNRSSGMGDAIPTTLGRFLALRPIVFIGLVSYSLYLWHWPVIQYAAYYSGNENGDISEESIAMRLTLISFGLLLGTLSWAFIEQPFRKKKCFKTRHSILKFGLLANLSVVLFAGSLVAMNGVSQRFSEIVVKNDRAKNGRGFRAFVTTEDIQSNRIPRLGEKGQNTSVAILLWGDSHAMHSADALDILCRRNGIGLQAITYPATPPITNDYFENQHGLSGSAHIWVDALIEHIKSRSIPHVVLAANWGVYQMHNAERLKHALRKTILTLDSLGCKVWVLQNVPESKLPVPHTLIRESSEWIGTQPEPWRTSEIEHREKTSVLYDLAKEKLPAVFIDPAPSLLDPATGHYRVAKDGISLYSDTNHLTQRGSELVLLPILLEAMESALAESD